MMDVHQTKNSGCSLQMNDAHMDMTLAACKGSLCKVQGTSDALIVRYFHLLSQSYQIHSLAALGICEWLVSDCFI